MHFGDDEIPAARLAVYWHPDDWVTLTDARLETLEALRNLAARLDVRAPSVLTSNHNPDTPMTYCPTHHIYVRYRQECPACSSR